MKHAHLIAQLGLLMSLLVITTHTVTASENQLMDIVNKVEMAYGGEKLTSLENFAYEDEYRETYPGQGYTPEYDELWEVRARLYHDLKNERGSGEGWGDQYGRIMQFQTQSVDGGIASIDYEQGTYRILPADTNYYQMFGRNIRASDTLLAFELVRERNKKTLAEPVNYLGKVHQQIILELPESPPLHLYINAAGHIKRMHRTYTNGDEVIYIFENQNIWNGITFAKEFQLFINGDFLVMTTNRNLLQGPIPESVFKLAEGLEPEPELFTTEEMTVTALSDKLHHVGQEDHSPFYDAGDYIIGLGGYGGLKERFEAYQKNRGHNKPLRFQIPTHHHTDHTAGLTDAIELGATLILPERLKAKIMADTENATDDQVRAFKDKETIDGLELYTISTPHTEILTVIYEPESKTLFQADHYGGFYKDRPNKLNRNSYSLYQGLKALNIDIKNILSAHVGKVEAWSAIENLAKDYVDTPCHFNRPVCPK